MKGQPKFQPECIYHIFNHANGKENLFESDENYVYFLKKYLKKLDGVVTTLSNCLMPNHFHLLIKIRDSDELEGFLQAKKQRIKTLFIPKELTQEKLYNFIVGRQFHNFLGGYAKAFNKFHNRKGSLMRQNTRRKIIADENYLVNAIMYIHLNPVLHGFTSHPEEWPFSSYHAFLYDSKTKIPRKLILDWFGSDKRNFIDLHENKLKDSLNPDWET